MISRRTFLGIVFTCCLPLAWFAPAAIALGRSARINPLLSLRYKHWKWRRSFAPISRAGSSTLSPRFHCWLHLRSAAVSARLTSNAVNTQTLGLVLILLIPMPTLWFGKSENAISWDTTGEVSKAYSPWLGHVSTRQIVSDWPKRYLRETFVKVNPAIHSTEVLARPQDLQAIALSPIEITQLVQRAKVQEELWQEVGHRRIL